MKVYVIFKNNEEEYDDYVDWIEEIYIDKNKAEKRFLELISTNQYKKDREIDLNEYCIAKGCELVENVGAYRLEEHETID